METNIINQKTIQTTTQHSFESQTRFYEHPDLGRCYAVVVNSDIIEVFSSGHPIHFQAYDGHLRVDDYVTKIDENNFIPLKI